MTSKNDQSHNVLEGLLPMLYRDALQPGVKQLGIALENVVGLVPVLTLPVKYLSEKAQTLMASHLERYRQKLQDKYVEQMMPVAPEIAAPILEKLAYTSDTNLSTLLIELLAKAGQVSEVEKIHPSFTGIIGNLSPDEARLTSYLANQINQPGWVDTHPVMELRLVHPDQSYQRLKGPFAEWDRFIELDFEGNFCAYVSNLMRLGLFEVDFDKQLRAKDRYEPIRRILSGVINAPPNGDRVELVEGTINFTDFGKMFLRACAN